MMIRGLHAALCLSLFSVAGSAACGSHSFEVPPTRVRIIEGAAAWAGLPEDLRAMQRVTGRIYGKEVGHEVFGLTLEIWPAYRPIETPFLPDTTGLGCLYEPLADRIRARDFGGSVAESSLPHEFWQHRLPHVLSRRKIGGSSDWNPGHDPYWEMKELGLRELTWREQ
jgi:hypothetical protein